MNKYNNKSNVIGTIIKKHREEKGWTKEDVCNKVQLHGVYIHRGQIYRIEKGIGSVKDFELIALCKALDIDYEKEVKGLVD